MMTCRTCGRARISSTTPAGSGSSTMMTSFGSSENWGSVTKICRIESEWLESTRTACPYDTFLVCVFWHDGDDQEPEGLCHPAQVRSCPHV